MMQRINKSLTAKLFGVTALLLVLACAITFTVIAVSLPSGYDITMADQLQSDLETLGDLLADVSLEDSGALLSAFQAQTGAQLELLDDNGESIPVDGLEQDASMMYNGVFLGVSVVTTEDTPERMTISDDHVVTTITMDTDYSADAMSLGMATVVDASAIGQEIRFKDDDTPYVLIARPIVRSINYAMEALKNLLPILAVTILCISLLGALSISFFVTKPIVRLSAISKRLAALDFSWTAKSHRTDEIGVLADNLQSLSTRLSGALEALKGQVKREQDLQRRRTDFFSAVSHELKTPLMVIQGQLEGMIAGVGVYADRDMYLEKTLEVARQMGGMIQDILRVFRMERADFTPQMEAIDLSAITQNTVAQHQALFDDNSIAVYMDIPESVPATGDAALLSQAIGNLLSNAARYSPEGEQTIVTVWAADNLAHVSIENTGVSIPADAAKHLFDAFYRLETSRNRALGGTGLGLHIVKTVLEQHGGECSVQNTSMGVRFTLSLPTNHTENT